MTHTEHVRSASRERDQVLAKVREYLGGSTDVRASEQLSNAWERFFEIHAPLINVMVSRGRLSADEVEDCAQEVWAEVVRCFPRLNHSNSPGAFAAWLANVARTRVARRIRTNKRRRAVCRRELDRRDRRMVSDEYCDRLHDEDLVATALARLEGETTRLNYCVVHQRMIEERSVEEVAERLGLSHEQVWYRQHRMMNALRAIIRDLLASGKD